MLLYVGFILIAFAAIAGLGFAFAGGGGSDKTSKRLTAIGGGDRLEKARGKAVAHDQAGRRKQILQNLKANERQERKAKLTLEARIRQAGLSISLRTFWIASGVLGLTLGVVALVLQAPPLLALGAAFISGLGLPRWVLGFLIARRI
jgi:tight adherence protein B